MQNVFEAIPNRLRLSGALRYNIGIYKSRAADAPVVDGQPLFPDDSARFEDFSGRIGATVTIIEGLKRRPLIFRAVFALRILPVLGSLGLVGVGFQVSTTDGCRISARPSARPPTPTPFRSGVAVSPLEIRNQQQLRIQSALPLSPDSMSRCYRVSD